MHKRLPPLLIAFMLPQALLPLISHFMLAA